MNIKKVVNTKGFWKSVIILALAFIVIYNIIDCGFSYEFDFNQFAQAKLSSTNQIIRFIIANIIGGFCYGFVVVFLQFRGKLKREEKKYQ
ncbi:hypothetical protein [Mesonia maritima]|uniref:Uncharacterized protein n=1 Tax=Mesonia maritima TaxID=1793873 RepID=A0ABU1KAN8_9FLAO|nr:hypothetical protein [Mesonia maritima]MDR6302097.1 hypothetical protein [Mesonia maritima]